ncbi:MAG TPA: hypothetical protein VKU85_21545 [bacterium]|nr:hypothetical protein [bacterium]
MTTTRFKHFLLPVLLVALAGCGGSGDPGEPGSSDVLTGPPVPTQGPEPSVGPSGRCPTAHPGPGTLTVVKAPAPCNDGPLWSGWRCVVLQSTANTNGVTYQVEARWNVVDRKPVGSWTWLVGGRSGAFFREGTTRANSVQDALVGDQIRSIDLKFLGTSGTQAFPRNGWVNISAVYADVLQWLVRNKVAEGVVGHVGSSGGATLIAAALANQGCHKYLDGVILGGGPWWIDLNQLCAQGSQAPKSLIDDWTWREMDGSRPCQQGRGADPSFDCMSILGSTSVKHYFKTKVAVLVGTQDPNGTFIAGEAQNWLSRITAESKSFERPATGHNVLSGAAGSNRVLALVRQITAAS